MQPVEIVDVSRKLYPPDVIFSIMLTLGGGAFFAHFWGDRLDRLKVPYEVFMFLFGMVIALIGFAFPSFGVLFDWFEKIDPQIILHIFLPILIFEGSFRIHAHSFRLVFWEVVILAGPGLAINSFYVAIALKLMFPDWSWYVALLLGSLLSATDAAAVVALLKGSADKLFTAVAEGEACINDGPALIFFTLLLPGVITGELQGSTGDLIVNSLRLCFLSIPWGILCGVAQSWFLRKCTSELLQVCITISVAFTSFYIANEYLLTSGVIALCMEGAFLAARRPSMFPGKEHSMFNSVWHFLVFFANTMLFALVGIVLIRVSAIDLVSRVREHFVMLLYIAVLYVVLIVARFAMLYTLLPIMNSFNYRMGHREVALLVHGALRGGVAVTLCLMVMNTQGISRDLGTKFLVLTSGVVLLTLTVNALTADKMVFLMGHRTKETNRKLQMSYGLQKAAAEFQRVLRHTKTLKIVSGANWSIVTKFIEGITNPWAEVADKYETPNQAFHILLMRAFKTSCWSQRDASHIGEDVVRDLTTAATRSIRRGELISTMDLHSYLGYPITVTILRHFPFAKNLVASLKATTHFQNYALLLAYAEALGDVEKVVGTYARTPEHLREARDWLIREQEQLYTEISRYSLDMPATAMSVFTRKAAELVFNQVMEYVNSMHDLKGFSNTQTEMLYNVVESAREMVSHLPKEIEPPNKEDLVRSSQMWPIPEMCVLELVLRMKRVEVARGEEVLLERCIGMVESGVISAMRKSDSSYGAASLFNIDAYVLGLSLPRRLHVVTDARMLLISFDDVYLLAREYEEFDKRIQLLGCIECCGPLLSAQLEYSGKNVDRMEALLKGGTVLVVPRNDFDCKIRPSDIVGFIKGRSTWGLVSHETQPFIVPRGLHLTWMQGTILFVLRRISFDDDERITSQYIQGQMVTPIGSPAKTCVVSPTFDSPSTPNHRTPAFPSLSGSLLSMVSRPVLQINPFYNPKICATRDPHLNQCQLNFLLAIAELSTAKRDHEDTSNEKTRDILSRSLRRTVKTVAEFCVASFTAEAAMYRSAAIPNLETHLAAHEQLSQQVGVWFVDRRRFQLRPAELLSTMEEFAMTHFPCDQRDVALATMHRLEDSDAAISTAESHKKKIQ